MTQFSAPITYSRPFAPFWSSDSTYNTALVSKSAKADVMGDSRTLLALSSATTGRAIGPVGPGSLVKAYFVGTSADNQTYSGRVWGWDFTSRDLSTPSTGQQWTAFPICDIAVTLSAKVGISGGLWTASYYYADTISVSNDRNGITASRVLALAGGDDSPALLVVDALGFQFIEFELTRSGGTAASINGAWSAVNGG